MTDGGRGSAISIIQSLGRAGYRVVVADADPRSPGFRSRFASSCRVLCDPAIDGPEFAKQLLALVEREGIDLVVPVTDAAILPLLEIRERLEASTRLALPGSDAFEALADKHRTFALARRLGIDVPETIRVESVAEAQAAADELGWPVVLKPVRSTRRPPVGTHRERLAVHAVTYANDERSLARRMRRFVGRTPVLVQRYCEGEGQGIALLLSRGRLVAAFQHRRLRELPPTGGASTLRESMPLDPSLLEASRRLLSTLDWTGVAMVEWKVGERAWLMEVNGRIWGSLPLAVASGVDFPARLAEVHLAEAPQRSSGTAGTPSAYVTGLRARDLPRELVWVASTLLGRHRMKSVPHPTRLAALAALVSLLDPRIRIDTFAWDDPRPAIASIRRLGPKLRAGVGRRRGSSSREGRSEAGRPGG